jgi:hypothetical protein
MATQMDIGAILDSTKGFDGATYEPEHDKARLTTQLERVKALMLDGQWRTLAKIQNKVGGTESSVSARLRDLRKSRFGGYAVDRRRRGEPSAGLFEYRVRVQ